MMMTNLKKIFVLYIILSVIGFFFLGVSSYFKVGVAFFLIINSVNLIVCISIIVFRKKLISAIRFLIDYSVDIYSQSNNISIEIYYRYEKICRYILIFTGVLIGWYALFLAFTDTHLYFVFITEDGFVENASYIFWMISFVFLSIHAFRMKPDNRILNGRLMIVLLMIFCFVCCGEEISWGERIFKFETSELMKAVNIQQETNFHDIGSISVFSNAFFVITFIFFIVIPWLSRKKENYKFILSYTSFPIPDRVSSTVYFIGIIFWIIIGIRYGTLGFHPFSLYKEKYYTQMDDEIFEMFTAYSFLVFSVMCNMKTITIKDIRNYK